MRNDALLIGGAVLAGSIIAYATGAALCRWIIRELA